MDIKAAQRQCACLLVSVLFLLALLTLHVEVAMEIWRPGAVQQIHSAITNFFICVNISIIVLIAVNELQKKKDSSIWID